MSESEVLVTYDGPLQVIQFNRPEKKNAVNTTSYSIILNALKTAAQDDKVKITLVTGVGDYFSSGTDFGQSTAVVDEDMDMVLRNKLTYFRELIRALIDYPKILIALVNGPAIGMAVTILGLFDLVYALKKATFQTPFSSLGIAAEGCSTYTFPRFLGKSLASKMLFFNYKMSVEEAKNCGFVAEIIPDDKVPQLVDELKKLGELPLKSLTCSKAMIRCHDVKSLHYANTLEIEKLVELFQSEDFLNAMMNAMLRKKSKL